MADGWDVEPLGPALGVEVRGLDLGRPLDEREASALRALFDEHALLLFRGQDVDEDDQLRVCSLLRPVVDPVAWVSNVEEGFHREGDLLWHCDFAFTPHPMLGLSLYAVDVDPDAAPTCFANNVAAHDALPAELRAALAERRVVHCIDAVSGRDNLRTRLDDVGGEDASPVAYPRHARPVIWTHPVTGRPLLFVLEQQASHFEGSTAAESDELLDAAFAHLYDPANVYRHRWEVGDLIVWDNLAVQHSRPANPPKARRSLRRVPMHTVPTADLVVGTGFDPAVRARLRSTADR